MSYKKAQLAEGARHPLASDLITSTVLEVIAVLHSEFEPQRKKLLQDRQIKQAQWNAGEYPTWCQGHPANKETWRVAPIPLDIAQRRVEITGPVNDTKMVINMLNPGPHGVRADTAMLDFEDSMKPTWAHVLEGHCNVIGAMKGDLCFVRTTNDVEGAKTYKINPSNMAHPMVRIRGLHLDEKNILVNGEPIAAGLFDLVLTAFHAVPYLIQRKKTPLYYIPKCEHFLESRYWNALFTRAEELTHHFAPGTLRVTYLIETLPAAFQMAEILYESKDRVCALNVGRWDKIFSDIKTLQMHKDKILADRSYIDMTRPWMDNYAKLLINICHKYGALAMGGMAAFTPGKDEKTRAEQTAKVIADKKREASLGHDGCWVSHPYFIKPALEQFTYTNQLGKTIADFSPQPDLLPQSEGPKTIEGVRKNIRVAVAYVRGWMQGHGCVAIDNLMEDLATLEISRAQIWQWLHHQILLDDGHKVTPELVHRIFVEETNRILSEEGLVHLNENEVKKEIIVSSAKAEEVFLRKDLAPFFGALVD